MITLQKADESDCPLIHRLQVRCFISMLEKYRDYSSNPAAESLDQVIQRFRQHFSAYYLICLDKHPIGFVRVCQFNSTCWISPVCILPEYQRKGYGLRVIECLEKRYPDTTRWALDTIQQEEQLCRFYEKAGFRPTGETKHIMDGLDLIYYEKGV